jgi:hypothetical protein
MEVGVVVISWEPGGSTVGNFIGLRIVSFVLHEAAEGFGISEDFLEGGIWSYPGSQFLLVLTAGEVVDPT